MPEMTPVSNSGTTAADMYSKILGIKQAQQNLRTGQAVQQSEIAGAKVAQQTALENQNIASLMSDPVGNGITDNEGKPTEGAYEKILKAAPNSGAERYEKIVSAATAKVGFNNALNNLNAQERADISGPISLVATDPNSKSQDLLDTVDQVVASKKGTPLEKDYARVGDFYKGVINNAKEKAKGNLEPLGQEKWRTMAQGLNRQVLPPQSLSGAGGVIAPSNDTYDTGTGTQPVVTAPALAGGGASPAGPQIAKSDVITLSNGQTAILNKATNRYEIAGTGQPNQGPKGPSRGPQTQQGPRTAQQDAPPPNAPKAVQDQYAQAVSNANQHVDKVRISDSDYGLNTKIADRIRDLSKNVSSGTGAATWHSIGGIVGMPVSGNIEADYQTLGAYLDRQAVTLRSAMGLPATNEGVATSQAVSGNTGYAPKAIQEKNDLNQALTEGLHQYRNGLDSIAGFGGQASPKAVDAYKSAWTNAFDPNVYIGELAYKRSKKDGDAFVASLDPQEAASLKQKRQQLKALSGGG